MEVMPGGCDSTPYFACGDSAYWNVVKQRLEIVPYLIEKLDDTTATKVRVGMEGIEGNYTVADIAFTAMRDIINDLPVEEFLGTKPWWHANYWNIVRSGMKARKDFKKRAALWFKENKENLVLVPCEQSVACYPFNGTHPNGGYYELKK
jgi:hypothetical protein